MFKSIIRTINFFGKGIKDIFYNFSFTKSFLRGPDRWASGKGFPCKMTQIGPNIFRIHAGYVWPNGDVLKNDFLTDGGSIPIGFQMLYNIDRFGKYCPCFFRHDWTFWGFDGFTFESSNEELRKNLIDYGMDKEVVDVIVEAIYKEGKERFGPEAYPGESNDPKSPTFNMT